MQPENTPKLRVLVSGHLPPPMGGIAAYYQTLLNSSLPERVNMRFVVTSSQNRELAASGRATFKNVIWAVQDCWRFARAVIAHRPQVAHIATAFGLSFIKHGVCVLIARLLGSKVLLHPHCSLFMLYHDRPNWWKWLFKRVILLTNGVIVLSQEWDELHQITPGVPVYYLPNGVDLKPYQLIAEEHLGEQDASDKIHVLYLGYLGKAKGSLDLVEAARVVKARGNQVIFDLVGSSLAPGERENVIAQAQAAEVNACLQIHPPAYGQEKLAFLHRARIFVYPSYHEGMPMAVLEAMACALPIVATRVGGLPDLVSDGENGLLIDPGCPDQIAEAVLRLASDEKRRRAMQQVSYQKAVECFSIEQRVVELVDIYQKTAGTLGE